MKFSKRFDLVLGFLQNSYGTNYSLGISYEWLEFCNTSEHQQHVGVLPHYTLQLLQTHIKNNKDNWTEHAEARINHLDNHLTTWSKYIISKANISQPNFFYNTTCVQIEVCAHELLLPSKHAHFKLKNRRRKKWIGWCKTLASKLFRPSHLNHNILSNNWRINIIKKHHISSCSKINKFFTIILHYEMWMVWCNSNAIHDFTSTHTTPRQEVRVAPTLL